MYRYWRFFNSRQLKVKCLRYHKKFYKMCTFVCANGSLCINLCFKLTTLLSVWYICTCSMNARFIAMRVNHNKTGKYTMAKIYDNGPKAFDHIISHMPNTTQNTDWSKNDIIFLYLSWLQIESNLWRLLCIEVCICFCIVHSFMIM